MRAAHDGVDLGQVDARVDPYAGLDVGGEKGGHPVAGLQEAVDELGEVVLALGVVGGEGRQEAAQPGRVEHVEADVDLGDRELVGRRVARLDDARQVAVRRRASRAVVDGVGQHDRGDGRPRRTVDVVAAQAGQQLGAGQRHVAVQDHDVAVEVGERDHAGPHGVAAAQALGLHGALRAWRQHAPRPRRRRAR